MKAIISGVFSGGIGRAALDDRAPGKAVLSHFNSPGHCEVSEYRLSYCQPRCLILALRNVSPESQPHRLLRVTVLQCKLVLS